MVNVRAVQDIPTHTRLKSACELWEVTRNGLESGTRRRAEVVTIEQDMVHLAHAIYSSSSTYSLGSEREEIRLVSSLSVR